MASKGQMTGMRGVYLAAAELTARNLIVSVTSRSARGVDILATDQLCKITWSIQVKTNGKNAAFWLLSEHDKEMTSDTHIYVLVNILPGDRRPEYFVVPSRIVSERMVSSEAKTGSRWWQIDKRSIVNFKDDWSAFGATTK